MRIAIIGAGLAGLSAAYELSKIAPEAEVEVFEAADRIGGKLYTVPFASGPTDVGAEAYLAFRRDATEFFAELGLKDKLHAPSGLPSLLYSGGKLHEMPKRTAMGIPANSDELGDLVDDATKAKIDAEGEQDEIAWGEGDMSLGQLVRERYGDQVVDHMVSALQGGVYSSSSDDLGIRATIPQLANTFDAMKEQGVKVTLSGAVERICSMRESNNKQMEAKVPGYKPQVFASFDGGYAEAYEALAEKSGATIHIDAFISGVTKNKDGFQLKGAGEGTFDKVLFATPAPTTAMLMKQILPEAVEPLKKIQLASSAVVAMKFESAEGLPDNSGVLVASDEQGVKAKAFTFSSKKWPHLGERGGALVRASFGRFGDDALVRAEEDDLVDWALDDLKTITGFDGREAELKEIYVQRWFGGLPVYGPDHLNTVDEIREILRTADGIEATGAWRDGVGVPNVIAEARAAAKRLIG